MVYALTLPQPAPPPLVMTVVAPFQAGTLYPVSPQVAAGSVCAYTRVLIFALACSSVALVHAWWPDLRPVQGRAIYLDDTPNPTVAYLRACVRAYTPVDLVIIEGWEMLGLDDARVPTRADPRLLTALRDLARHLAVPVIVCGVV